MASTSNTQAPAKEYIVRVPKQSRKKYHMMRFNSALGSDFFKSWTHCKIERENNFKEYKEEEIPKFGAGSEYGRELKEEARRKRLGINKRNYKPDDQPWLLSVGGKGSKKKYKGIREGGVSDHAAWYVFMQGKDGSFEASPVEEWYNFQPINRYKSLSAEEAEQEFQKRDNIMNFFQVMINKKIKKDEGGPEEEGKQKASKGKDMLLSEMDDWVDDEDEDEEGDDDDDSDGGRSKKKKKTAKRKVGKGGKKKRREDGASDDSCLEESDDYNEGAEHDYISSDSSDSDQENDEKVVKDLAGVEEGDALKKLLESESDSEENKEKSEKSDNEEEKEEKPKEKAKKLSKKRKRPNEESGNSDSSGDEAAKPGKKENSTVNKLKKRVKENPMEMNASKKNKMNSQSDNSATPGTSVIDSPVSEEAIRRYLMRKPMTTTELLQKFKSKKTGLNSEQLVESIAQVLKRVNPTKKMIKGKMYMSL